MELLTKKKQSDIELLEGEAEVKVKSQKKLVGVIAVVILLSGCLIAFGLWGYNFYQQLSLNKIKTDITEKVTEWQRLEAVGTKVKSITSKDQIIDQTNKKYAGVDKNLDKIRNLLPQGVSLVTLKLDSTGKVTINGKAADAAVVYQLYEVLKADKEVKTPKLNSLLKTATDYTFDISLTLVTK